MVDKKKTAILLIAVFTISTFAVMCEATSRLFLIQASSGTEVGGIISEDTVLSSGHYIATAHILVPEGVTLTIDPGVEISLEDHFIQVDGTLRAIGTENKKIIITGSKGQSYDRREGRIFFTGISKKWNEDNKTGSILEYCELSSNDGVIVGINSGAFPKISNCILRGTSYDAIWAHEGLIVNNTISNNGRGIVTLCSDPMRETSLSHQIFIIDNIISKNELGIYVGQGYYSPIIAKNIISDNRGSIYHGGGIRIDGPTNFTPEIKNNTIYNNSPHGIIIVTYTRTDLSINYNNIYNNSDYDFYLYDSESDINVSYNWWGTTNTTVIEDNIYDFNEDFRLGKVIYKPILQNTISNFKVGTWPPLRPAEFVISDLTITPEDAKIWEEIEIRFTVTNIGEETGNYQFSLLIEEPYAAESVEMVGILGAGESETATHKLNPQNFGFYTFEVDGLREIFSLKAPILTPAEFEFSNLEMAHGPPAIVPGESIMVSATITNIGEMGGIQIVELKLDGLVVDSRSFTVNGGGSELVTFTFPAGEVGEHIVEIDGLSESFTVSKQPLRVPATSFWDKIPGFPYESIILGLIAVIIILWQVMPWSRARAKKGI